MEKNTEKTKRYFIFSLSYNPYWMWNSNEAEVNKQEETTTNVEEKENSTETTTTDEFVKIGVIGSSKSMGTCKSEMNP